jgi:phosphoribosylglycinamide formyltransferase-1
VEKKKISLVVLISGGGSNLQAIIDAIANDQLDAEIKAVISNQVSAAGLDRAARANIDSHVVDHKQFPDRRSFDRALISIIDPLKPDLVILAGFMRILSDEFIDHYHDRLLNIHPSLLPKYKGLNTHQLAIDNHDAAHGASVHYVSHELDSGPIVIQAEVPVLEADDKSSLASRVLEQEHKIYPMAIQLVADGRLTFDGSRVSLDSQPMTEPLHWKDEQASK